MKPQIRRVPARSGLQWFRLGAQTFGRRSLSLSLLYSLPLACSLALALIPFIGQTLGIALQPLLMLTMMAATVQAFSGERPGAVLLLVAFGFGRRQLYAVLVLGAMFALAWLAILGVAALIDGGCYASACLAPASLNQQALPSTPHPYLGQLTAALCVPLYLVFWQATGLVHWYRRSPAKALLLAAAACLRNWRAFGLLGLVQSSFLLALMVGVRGTLLLELGAMAQAMVLTITLLAALVNAVIWQTALVFSFRDCFAAPAAASSETDSTDLSAA